MGNEERSDQGGKGDESLESGMSRCFKAYIEALDMLGEAGFRVNRGKDSKEKG